MTSEEIDKVKTDQESANKVQKKRIFHVKSWLAYFLLILMLGWAMDAWRGQSMASGKAPDLIATTVQGETVDLLLMSQDKPVLVYFWATWCSVCSTVSPSVDLLSDYYQVVTVALTSGQDKRIQQYLAAKEYDFAVINDEQGLMSRNWGVSVTPSLFVIDKGEITSMTTGFTSPMGMWARLQF